MGRAYSPLLLGYFPVPGALPQAGMDCAFGAPFQGIPCLDEDLHNDVNSAPGQANNI